MYNKETIDKISKETGIKIRELNRLNRDYWYHGTTIESAQNIVKNGVIANYNLGKELDFGAGFYLTDTHERASKYISRVPLFTLNGDLISRKEWAVIEFAFNPLKLLDTDIIKYKYHSFPKHDTDFANFVLDNRSCNYTRLGKFHSYDMIWGVMSDNQPFEIVMNYKNAIITRETAVEKLQKPNSMHQLYIANQDICDMLKINSITKGGERHDT